MDTGKHIMVRTFGFFDIFVENELVVFSNNRSKEMLAILINQRGNMIPNGYMLDVLWPEEPDCKSHRAALRRAWMDLKKTLSAYGIGDILASKKGFKAVLISGIDCDYYNALDGDSRAVSEYYGVYMTQYSWAEETNARLYAQIKSNEGSELEAG